MKSKDKKVPRSQTTLQCKCRKKKLYEPEKTEHYQ